MSIFDFVAAGVEEALMHTQVAINDSRVVEAELRRVLAPLENGGWIGQGAEAYFQEMHELLAENDRLQQELTYFHTSLNQAMQTVIATMQTIDNITRTI